MFFASPGGPPYELLAFWISLVAAGVCMFPILGLLKRLKIRQTISQYVPEHQAKQGTPTMGGMITLCGVVIALIVMLIPLVQELVQSRTRSSMEVLLYLVLIVLFGAVGFVDDYVVPKAMPGKRGLGWKQKILLEIILAGICLAVFSPTGWVADLLGLFVILFFANAYNFTDGLDGLAGSVGAVLLLGLTDISLMTPNASVIGLVAMAIVGGLIPFLFLNLPPAKLFMGDVGSLPIGAAIGLMVWQLGFKGLQPTGEFVPLFVISGVMVFELVPVPIQIASVKLRKKKIFPKTPIHHTFQERGIAETRIVGAYLLTQTLLSAAAISLTFLSNQVDVIK